MSVLCVCRMCVVRPVRLDRGAAFARGVVSARVLVWSGCGYSGWNNASVLPSGSLNQADLPMPAVVAMWLIVFSAGKS